MSIDDLIEAKQDYEYDFTGVFIGIFSCIGLVSVPVGLFFFGTWLFGGL